MLLKVQWGMDYFVLKLIDKTFYLLRNDSIAMIKDTSTLLKSSI